MEGLPGAQPICAGVPAGREHREQWDTLKSAGHAPFHVGAKREVADGGGGVASSWSQVGVTQAVTRVVRPVRPTCHLGADSRVEALCPVGVVQDIDDLAGVDTVEDVEASTLDSCSRRQGVENGIVGPARAKRLPIAVSPRKSRVQLLVGCRDVSRHQAGPPDSQLCQQFGIVGVRKDADHRLPPLVYHRETKAEQRRTAGDGQSAAERVDCRQRSPKIGAQLDDIIAGDEQPRLGVEHRGCAHRRGNRFLHIDGLQLARDHVSSQPPLSASYDQSVCCQVAEALAFAGDEHDDERDEVSGEAVDDSQDCSQEGGAQTRPVAG